MSLLSFLKTGPGMAAAGGAGIGWAMLTVWGSGVAGTNINYSYVEFPNEEAQKFLGFQSGQDNAIVLKSNWDALIEKGNYSNDYYGAISTSCMAIMFPHMPFHWGSHFKLDTTKKNLNNQDKNTLLVTPTSTPSPKDSIQACAGMVMSRKANKFLFTSEVSMRKGKRGISLWTAVKSSNDPFKGTPGDKAKIKIRQFISFFEWSGGDWRTKGGYSWGGKDIELTTWTIKAPDESKIKEEFKKGDTTPKDRKDTFYYGVWKSGSGENSPFTLDSENGYSTGNSLVIEPTKAKGYGEANAFLKLPNSDSEYNSGLKPWKQYCTNGTTCGETDVVKVNVKENLETWFAPFKESKGSWTSRPIPSQ